MFETIVIELNKLNISPFVFDVNNMSSVKMFLSCHVMWYVILP